MFFRGWKSVVSESLAVGAASKPWIIIFKKLLRSKITKSDLRDFKNEAELMLGLRHPNVIQCLGGSW